VDDDHDLEVIRHQMEETRSSLADKLETLESQFCGTVEGATEAVSHTVEVVQETVETVKETFDLRKQTDRHPWGMLTGAVAVGFVVGRMTNVSASPTSPAPTPTPVSAYQAAPAPAARPAPSTPGLFDSSIEKLKGLAIGGLMSVVRELVFRNAPSSIVSELAGVVDDLTTKLGGKPLRRATERVEPESRTEEESRPAAETPASEPARSGAESPPARPRPNGRGKRRPARI